MEIYLYTKYESRNMKCKFEDICEIKEQVGPWEVYANFALGEGKMLFQTTNKQLNEFGEVESEYMHEVSSQFFDDHFV